MQRFFFGGGRRAFSFSVYLFDNLAFGAWENWIYEWRFYFLCYLEGVVLWQMDQIHWNVKLVVFHCPTWKYTTNECKKYLIVSASNKPWKNEISLLLSVTILYHLPYSWLYFRLVIEISFRYEIYKFDGRTLTHKCCTIETGRAECMAEPEPIV